MIPTGFFQTAGNQASLLALLAVTQAYSAILSNLAYLPRGGEQLIGRNYAREFEPVTGKPTFQELAFRRLFVADKPELHNPFPTTLRVISVSKIRLLDH
jgi:hypothetical protein